MSAPIVITVPTKYVPINLAPVAIKREVQSASFISSDAEESTSSMDEFLVRGKKRRLDHLTWEEKVQRKKLKNRVAAQTSRDRKKAKMEEMEHTIEHQKDQITELQGKCEMLTSEKDAIYSKYLDLESRFEELQRRFDEQQEQQRQQQVFDPTTIKSEPESLYSAGCATNPLGSAAGNLFVGSTDGTAPGTEEKPAEQQRKDCGAVEDHCSLPALQDILEDFDVSKLEELAESLLANITSELEDTDRGSSSPNAEDAGTCGRVLGSVVGTAPEQLEPGKEADKGSSSLILTTHNYSKSPFHVPLPLESQQADSHQQTLFGTYDDESNCITIVLNDDEYSMEEEIIYEESEEEQQQEEEVSEEHELEIKLEPVQGLLSPIPSLCSSYSSTGSDGPLSMHDDEEQQRLLKCPLTPKSLVSDGGYESLGSPLSSTDYGINSLDEIWNLDLFPILS